MLIAQMTMAFPYLVRALVLERNNFIISVSKGFSYKNIIFSGEKSYFLVKIICKRFK